MSSAPLTVDLIADAYDRFDLAEKARRRAAALHRHEAERIGWAAAIRAIGEVMGDRKTIRREEIEEIWKKRWPR